MKIKLETTLGNKVTFQNDPGTPSSGHTWNREGETSTEKDGTGRERRLETAFRSVRSNHENRKNLRMITVSCH